MLGISVLAAFFQKTYTYFCRAVPSHALSMKGEGPAQWQSGIEAKVPQSLFSGMEIIPVLVPHTFQIWEIKFLSSFTQSWRRSQVLSLKLLFSQIASTAWNRRKEQTDIQDTNFLTGPVCYLLITSLHGGSLKMIKRQRHFLVNSTCCCHEFWRL